MTLVAIAFAVVRRRAALFWRIVKGAYHGLTQRIVPKYRITVANEYLPKKLKRHRLYVVEEDGFEEQAAMLCPCGCTRILHLNLLSDERPCWSLTRHADGTASLSPSVWRKKDCGSHFWLRRGRVQWARGQR